MAEVAALPADQLPPRPPSPTDGTPATALSAMLASTQAEPAPDTGSATRTDGPVDLGLMRLIAAVEQSAGQSAFDARTTALALLSAQRSVVGERIEPPPMAHEAFQARLATMMAQLDTISVAARSAAE